MTVTDVIREMRDYRPPNGRSRQYAKRQIDKWADALASSGAPPQKIELTSDQLGRIFADIQADRFTLFDIALDQAVFFDAPGEISTPLSVLEWACERLSNSEGIAAAKSGADRDGWLEDVSYWRQIVAVLASGAPQRTAEGWRPIATAPKDGTDVLLTDGSYRRVGYWASRINAWSIDAVGPLKMPTHWAPIPTSRNPQIHSAPGITPPQEEK